MTHTGTVIALITGPDAATARIEVDRLRQQHDPENLNTVRLDGKDITVEEAVAAVSTTAFFGSCRVVIIEGLMARLNKGAKATDEQDDGDSRSTANNFDLRRLFSAVTEPNVLILVDPSLSAVPAAVKKAAPPNALVVIGEPPRGERLIAWLLNAAKNSGTGMDKRAAFLLAEMKYPRVWREKPANPAFDRPPDLDDLLNEVEKLALAAHPGPIREEHVRMMVSGTGEERLFPFLDAALTGKLSQALNELVSLQASGEDPAKLLAQLLQEIELSVLASAGGNRNPEEVGRAAGLSNPRRMTSVAKRLAGMTMNSQNLLMSAVDIDRLAKRGMLRHPADALYHVLTAAGTTPRKRGKGGR